MLLISLSHQAFFLVFSRIIQIFDRAIVIFDKVWRKSTLFAPPFWVSEEYSITHYCLDL